MRYTDEESHLRGEYEFVSLKEATRRIGEHRVRDAIDEIDDALFDLLGRLGAVDRLLEHDAERLNA